MKNINEISLRRAGTPLHWIRRWTTGFVPKKNGGGEKSRRLEFE
jgi:hypothetical protein